MTLTLVLAACSAAVVSPYTRSGFLSDPSIKTVSQVLEHNEYAVTFNANQSSEAGSFNLNAAASYLVTDLSVYESDGTIGKSGEKYYLFETHTHVEGSFSINGANTASVSDVSSKVYLCGLSDGFKPVYSTRTVVSDTPEEKNGALAISKYSYTITTEYTDGNAKVTVTPAANVSAENDALSSEYELENVFASNYIDNEALLFAPRAIALSTSTSLSFNCIDALSKSNNSMSLYYAEIKNVEFEGGSYERKKEFTERVSSVSTIALGLAINSEYSGSPQKLSFAQSSEAHEYSRLISLSVPAAYNMGTFEFIIKNSTISFN